MEKTILISPYTLILIFALGVLVTLLIQIELKSFAKKREKEQFPIKHYILIYGFKFFIVLTICSFLYVKFMQ